MHVSVGCMIDRNTNPKQRQAGLILYSIHQDGYFLGILEVSDIVPVRQCLVSKILT